MRGSGSNPLGQQSPTQAAPGQTPTDMAALRTQASGAKGQLVLWLVGLIAAYVIWVFVERHEKVSQAIQPKNLALNLRQAFAVFLPVVVMILLFKILTVKLALWTKTAWAKSLAMIAGAL